MINGSKPSTNVELQSDLKDKAKESNTQDNK